MSEAEKFGHKICLNSVYEEFDSGFSAMKGCDIGVAVFGSSRLKPGNPYYESTLELAAALAKKQYSIITGGGPGIMEAANKGAYKGKGESYGMCIKLSVVEPRNEFVDHSRTYDFDHFFVRKAMFLHHAEAFVCFPGGYGTLDELFECLVMFQMHKIPPKPIYLFGASFWSGLYDWMKETLIKLETISEKDLDLIVISDSTEDIIDDIDRRFSSH